MLKSLYRFLHPRWQTVFLDYKVDPKPRYGLKPHPLLNELLVKRHEDYAMVLHSIAKHKKALASIPKSSKLTTELHWDNQYFPMFDIMILYAMVEAIKPNRFVEVGSGTSTLVVNKARMEFDLDLKIISIDPQPRQSIRHIVETHFETAFEELDQESLQLKKGDMLFIDNSHRVLPNSDSMVFFMEILPSLPSGVIVHLHDIYLPYDYPQVMCDRYYNEQYTLAAFLLSNPERYTILFPGYYVSQNKDFQKDIGLLFAAMPDKHKEQHGGSFWIEIR